MMIKSYYNEGLFFQPSQAAILPSLGESIQDLLNENHGVGILGGTYDEGLPIFMVSELTVRMLGYESIAVFEVACHRRMGELFYSGFSHGDFIRQEHPRELHLRGRRGPVWVRLVKRDPHRRGRDPLAGLGVRHGFPPQKGAFGQRNAGAGVPAGKGAAGRPHPGL